MIKWERLPQNMLKLNHSVIESETTHLRGGKIRILYWIQTEQTKVDDYEKLKQLK
jgi:hypothetical protein